MIMEQVSLEFKKKLEELNDYLQKGNNIPYEIKLKSAELLSMIHTLIDYV